MSNICLVFFMYQLLIFVLCFYIFVSDKYLSRVILIFVLNMNISHNILFFLQNISHNIERNENQLFIYMRYDLNRNAILS